jgi:hypothetical protein
MERRGRQRGDSVNYMSSTDHPHVVFDGTEWRLRCTTPQVLVIGPANHVVATPMLVSGVC